MMKIPSVRGCYIFYSPAPRGACLVVGQKCPKKWAILGLQWRRRRKRAHMTYQAVHMCAYVRDWGVRLCSERIIAITVTPREGSSQSLLKISHPLLTPLGGSYFVHLPKKCLNFIGLWPKPPKKFPALSEPVGHFGSFLVHPSPSRGWGRTHLFNGMVQMRLRGCTPPCAGAVMSRGRSGPWFQTLAVTSNKFPGFLSLQAVSAETAV